MLNYIKKRWKTIVCNSLCIYLLGCTTHQVTRNMWGSESSGCFDSGYKSSDYLDNEQIASSASNEDQGDNRIINRIIDITKELNNMVKDWLNSLDPSKGSKEKCRLISKLKSESTDWDNFFKELKTVKHDPKPRFDWVLWMNYIKKFQNKEFEGPNNLKSKLDSIPGLVDEEKTKVSELFNFLYGGIRFLGVLSYDEKAFSEKPNVHLLNQTNDSNIGDLESILIGIHNRKMYGMKETLEHIQNWIKESNNYLKTDVKTNRVKRPAFKKANFLITKNYKEKDPKHNFSDQNRPKMNFKTRGHKQIHPEKEGEGFKCDKCKKVFKQKSDLTRHKTVHPKEGEQGFNCPDCDAQFKVKPELIRHRKEKHGYQYNSSKKITEECEICDQPLTAKRNKMNYVMKRHKENVHKEDNFNCTDCSAPFKHQSKLTIHINKWCKKKQKNSSLVRVNRHTHAKTPDYPNVKKITTTKRIQTSTERFCGICDKSFANKSSLQRHKKEIHENQQSSEAS